MSQTKVTSSDISSNVEPASTPATSGYVLTADGAGNTSWGVGGGGGGGGTYTRTQATGDSSTTVFTVPTYVLGNNSLLVYNDGVLMEATVDYTETSTTSITFATAPVTGATLSFIVASTNAVGPTGPTGATGPSGSPAGANNQLQFYNSGVFGADPNLNWDPTDGSLQIGAASSLGLPSSLPGVLMVADSEVGAIGVTYSNTANFCSNFAGLKAGGTQASPAATPSGSRLVDLVAIGYTGSSFDTANAGGTLRFTANQVWSPTDHGTDFDIKICAFGATTNQTLMYGSAISGTAYLGVGPSFPSAATPSAILDIWGNSGTTLRIVDTNQGSGKVLTSDSGGFASWQTLPTASGFTGSGNFTNFTIVNGLITAAH